MYFVKGLVNYIKYVLNKKDRSRFDCLVFVEKNPLKFTKCHLVIHELVVHTTIKIVVVIIMIVLHVAIFQWGGLGFNVLDVDTWLNPSGLYIESFHSSKKLPHGVFWLVHVALMPHPVAYK